MDELKKFISDFLAKTQGMNETEIAALFNAEGNNVVPEALPTVLAKDAARIKEKSDAYADKVTKAHEAGYSKAKGEVLTEFEKGVKEKFNLQSDKKGLELVDELVSKKSVDKTITDEDVKKHPAYLKLETDSKTAVEKKDSEWKEKWDKMESDNKQRETFSSVLGEAMTVLDKLKPNLPEDAARKKSQLKWFENDIQNLNYEILDKDGKKTIVLLKKDSKDRLEDEFGHRITFEDHVKQLASSYWDFQQSEPRNAGDPNNKGAQQNQGGNGQAGGTAKKWKLSKPKDDKEFQTKMAELEGRKDLTPSEKTSAKMELVNLFQEAPAN